MGLLDNLFKKNKTEAPKQVVDEWGNSADLGISQDNNGWGDLIQEEKPAITPEEFTWGDEPTIPVEPWTIEEQISNSSDGVDIKPNKEKPSMGHLYSVEELEAKIAAPMMVDSFDSYSRHSGVSKSDKPLGMDVIERSNKVVASRPVFRSVRTPGDGSLESAIESGELRRL